MKKSKLTLRQKKIIQIISASTNNKSITISAIAEKLDISPRTVLREMPTIKNWLIENDFTFVQKTGVGLILDETQENRQLIVELLELENIKDELSKEEIKKIIIVELIMSKEPLKLYYFTSILKLSEATISSYLDDIEELMKDFNINIIRRQGIGIYLEGSEESYRKILSELLYTSVGENKIIQLLASNENKDKQLQNISIENKIIGLVDKDIIEKVQRTLEVIQEEYKFRLSDSSYIGLVIHLSLAIKRLLNNETIVMNEEVLDELRSLSEFVLAEKIVNKLAEFMDIEIPKDEIGYITMHIKGANLNLNSFGNNLSLENLDVMKISISIIDKVESELGIKIQDREQLNRDLSNHLVPAISRLSMKLNIRNPLLDEIKQNYLNIYNACGKGCEVLKSIAKISDVPESEIAYVAIHIAGAIERGFIKEKVNVVIVCPTGVGTSKLLSINIRKEFDNINIIGIRSAININIERLIKEEVDFIISTTELWIDYRYIVISPFLSNEDIQKLKNFIKEIPARDVYKRISYTRNKFSKENMEYISKLSGSIVSLLNNLYVNKLKNVSSVDNIIELASDILTDDSKTKFMIQEDLKKREMIDTTYLDGYDLMFLHCRTKGVNTPKFAVVQFESPFILKGKVVEFATVSLLPYEFEDYEIEIFGELSTGLIENDNFRLTLRLEDKNAIYLALESRLGELLKKYLFNFMEEYYD